jgi:hypothetical protein
MNEISYFKMNENENNFIQAIYMIMDYQFLVINYVQNNLFK